MHCHDHLAAIFVTPFLVAAGLGNHRKTMLAQNFDDFSCAANWIPPAHGTASSIIFAPLGNLIGAGSNQSASASWALVMASASVSPAVAQPGNSGNTADQRLASGSNSTNNRNFIIKMITARPSSKQGDRYEETVRKSGAADSRNATSGKPEGKTGVGTTGLRVSTGPPTAQPKHGRTVARLKWRPRPLPWNSWRQLEIRGWSKYCWPDSSCIGPDTTRLARCCT